MLACAGLLALPAGASAQDPAAEVPDISATAPQGVTSGPSFSVARSSNEPELWATVNICDTARAPDSMGIRASMPGNLSDQHMFMRFTAEYWSRANAAWTPVSGSGTSPWVHAGPADHGRRQAGWTFAFSAPPENVTFTMRARVEFQWRAKEARVTGRSGRRRGKRGAKRRRSMTIRSARAGRWDVVRTAVRTTETGIEGVHGGDPDGTSKAMCLIY
jgi:hypothetical protein